MSAPRSNQSKMLKRFGNMAEQYQARIDNQQEIISRLTTAVSLAQSSLYNIEHDSKDVRAARKAAKEAQADIIEALKKEDNNG